MSWDLEGMLAELSKPEPAPAGGSVAGAAVAMAAALLVKAARLSRRWPEAAEAERAAAALRDRAAALSAEDARAFEELREARRRFRAGEPSDVETALSRAVDVPLEIAAAAAETAVLAARVVAGGNPNLVADAAMAAILSAAAGAGAAILVSVNLEGATADPRLARAGALAAAAAENARQATTPAH